jgi:V8-like Glu-specific endopeptidase
MAAANHRPLSSPDRPPTAAAADVAGLEAVLEVAAAGPPLAAAAREPEAVVLPYYRSPRERARQVPGRERGTLAAFGPIDVPEAPAIAVADVAEGSFGQTTILEAVIGNDDRVKLADDLYRSNPWRQICSLRIRAVTGAIYLGTAWFIGPRILATAGHCVYLRNEGGWAASIDVVPGRNGQIEPYGRATAIRFAAVDGWIDSGARDFDYGVIFLADSTIGTKVGNLAVETFADADLVGLTCRISGYPTDLDGGAFQYYHERPLASVTPARLIYDVDTFGGQSGSPIWRQEVGSPAVAIGIHTTGGLSSNSGTRISDEVIGNLIRWSEEA